jgi:hypothetical protein
MDIKKDRRKNKIMQWGYTILIWVIPFLYLTLFPWIKNYTKFLARDEIIFGPNASVFYHNLSVFILPIVFNVLIGAGLFILVVGMKNYKSKAVLGGCILGVIYPLLILLSYPIYFNIRYIFKINLFLINQIFSLGMYTGPGNPSLMLVFYGLLLYQIVKKHPIVESN